MKNKLILSLSAFILLSGCIDFSDGERVGAINKLSRKGFFCKTWEGEMNLGGFRNKTTTDNNGNSSSSIIANVFAFTVEDESLIPAIKESMLSGRTVTITYRQELFTFCRSDSNYFVTAISFAR